MLQGTFYGVYLFFISVEGIYKGIFAIFALKLVYDLEFRKLV